MTRDLILGTAGHIDHGKTALVKALTGTDCDRLPEEKRRGITIDIGFATLDLGDVHLGIVDVPGHERFIRNMLAGATGIDLVMLVVAADDSVMPQTREHLEIVKLLGLKHGLIALTKCDLVDATTREVVELEIRELVRGTFLADAPLVPTSAHTGQGIAELKTVIAATARQVEARAESEWFRLAIDRSFIVQGHGTVVTGSVTSGSVAVGDELEWQPRGETVRVRSLQNHGQAVQRVQRGQRAALNLAGVHHENVIRGQELGAPGYLTPSRTFTVQLHCPKNAPRPIKHRASIRFHLGTAEIMGAVSLLDADRIEPGGSGLAQVFLEAPTTAVWGQPFVIRAPSATQTLGGGQVLQPTARKVRRQQPDMLARLAVLATGNEEARALETAWFAGLNGVTAAELVRGAGLTPAAAETALQQLLRRGALAEVHGAEHLVHAAVIRDLEDRILKSLARLHAEFPLAAGHERQKLHAELAYLGNAEAIDLALRGLEHRKKIVSEGLLVRRGDFKPTLSNSQTRLREKVLAGYREAGMRPPRAESFAAQAGGNASNLNDLFAVCVAEGKLIHLDEDYYVDPAVEAQARELLTPKLANGAALTVAEIRDILNTGRKHALLFCAYYDRIGFTRRNGDLRTRGKS